MVTQPDVWLRVDAASAPTIHFEKSLKKALLAASLRYEFDAAGVAKSEAEAEIKIPFRDTTKFRCSTDIASAGSAQNAVAFSSYIEEDPVRARRTQWTPSPGGGLRCEISGGSEPTQGSAVQIPMNGGAPVLNPLLLLPALGSSRRADAKSYGAYFVAGRRLYAAYLEKQAADARVYTVLFSRVPNSAHVQWASLDWANAQRAELEWGDEESRPTEFRANAPLIGLIRVGLN